MNDKIHIGKLIKQKMKKDGRTDTWLAERLGCVKSNISDIYDRQSIDTDLLSRICIHLEVDYHILYSEPCLSEHFFKRL